LTTHLYNATAHLAHLLLRDTRPNAHAKAKEPNSIALNKDGALVFSEDISDVAASGPDYQMTFKYVKG
jgi:hypothetical protein